jgi:hypothetical protein
MLKKTGYHGFFFADFHGDHVIVNPGDKEHEERVEPADVMFYNNCLTCELPPDIRPDDYWDFKGQTQLPGLKTL